ncbi:MAG TPA: cytochrome c-type biogenesis CcmF C-terminal domain-containing protein [Vicinamibacterales bacterium]|nr:cytochrome c-type biogenesis CcmF C-terminal domain-containing protein [Vicinamibacterales bacterium]
MASLGSFTLLAAFVACSYAAVVSVVGARRRSTRLVESGVGAFYLIAALMTVASAVMINAFITGDYTIKYVVHYSDSVQPLFYKLTSYWGGLDGSIMFWVFLLSLFGSLAVYVNRERYRELIPYVVATISVVQMFFLYLMVVHRNPFATYLTQAPAEGTGLSPLLQNFYMAIHPPSLYTGFVGMTIPYAFCIAALVTGHLDDSWLRAVRRWTMFAWLFLSLGLFLGMIWAYEELGWGGYWMWDPVENAAALPWFTATAFLHSVMVQERRSMLRVWNVTLVITTFFLTIFGTFMTRSGVVQSVHAFGDDPVLAKLFTGFMVIILVFSFGLVIYRLPLLKARNELDSWFSREAAFLVNNWILLFSALLILFGTMFPTLSEAITGERLTVAAPFFNKWMRPVGLILLLLTGVGPLLAWRKSTVRNVVDQFLFPVTACAVTLGAMVLLKIPIWASGLCFALCALVLATITQEFWRGAMVRRRNTGTDILTALIGLVGRNKRRYGGYVVHVGIVLIFFGFAGNGSRKDTQVLLAPGQSAAIGRYSIQNNGVKVSDDGQKQMTTAYLTVFVNGKEIDRLYPAKWAYRHHEQEPTTEVAIRRTVAEDLYATLGAFDLSDQTATLEFFVNPLVDWIWFGFGILALGTGIALLPERAFSFAVARLPAAGEAAAASTVALLLVVLLGGTTLSAQKGMGGGDLNVDTRTSYYARTDLEKQLQHEIVCTCGACGHASIAECRKDPCGVSHEMRGEVAALLDQGKTHDEVIQAVLAKYGNEEMLGAPIDKGFNRLVWLFPYLMAGVGIVVIGFAAVKWTRHPEKPAEALPAADPDLDDRINDELRDLD